MRGREGRLWKGRGRKMNLRLMKTDILNLFFECSSGGWKECYEMLKKEKSPRRSKTRKE